MDTKALRQKVLDLAIRGKLVPQDPNDEPASVLLERIRQQKQQMVKEGKLKAKDIKNDTIIFVGEDNLHYEKFADGSLKCIEDEIPFDLPDGWAWARLGTVAEAIGDGDHQPPPQTSFGVPFLVISNVSGGRLSFENTRFVGEEYFRQLPETRKPRNGDLLFTVTGSYGIPVLVDTDDKFCFQRHIAIIRPCIVSNRYLYVVLGSSYVKSICDDKATGTAQKTVGLATLRELLIPIAPYKEQGQIYVQTQNALSMVDSISSDKEDLLNIIEHTKSKILDLAIRGKLVPQDPDDDPASVLLEHIRAEKEELIRQGKIKRDKKESVIFRGEDNSYYEKIGSEVRCIDEEILFEIPESWRWCRLCSLSDIIMGSSPSGESICDDQDFPEFHQGKSYFSDCMISYSGQHTKEITKMAEPGAVLLCVRAPVGEVNLTNRSICIGRGLAAIKAFDNILEHFLFYWLQAFKPVLVSKATGTTFVAITTDVVKGLLIPVPSLHEQRRILSRIQSAYAELDKIEKSLN